MIALLEYCLKGARKILTHMRGINDKPFSPSEIAITENDASELIARALSSDSPCMIARFGSFELNAVLNTQSVLEGKHSVWRYVMRKDFQFWWDEDLRVKIRDNAGFFPVTDEMLVRYKERMFADMKELDILGDYCRSVSFIENELKGVKRVHLKDLEPFYGLRPWTRALAGKKVLVVHPLAVQILDQYKKYRNQLFKDPEILPEFSLEAVTAVQSLAGQSSFQNWFDALAWMESEIDKHDYDICLIGCGAYGFCLAAHCKRMGKKGFHIGGILQYLFGIIGKRWENPAYNVKEWAIPEGFYSSRINGYWVRPKEALDQSVTANVEGGCYW